MENRMDPHVRAMLDAGSDAERAGVLLCAPVFTLMRWREAFRQACRRAAFDVGVAYLDAWHDSLSNTRQLGAFRGDLLGAAKMPLLYLVHPLQPMAEGKAANAARERRPRVEALEP